jgi:hypothetical protein
VLCEALVDLDDRQALLKSAAEFRRGEPCASFPIIGRVLPALDLAAIRAYCEQRVPPHALHQVRVEAEVAARSVTIVERRAPWRPEYGPEWTRSPIARLRYTQARAEWTLYWRDRNQRFHLYDLIPPSRDVTVLLEEVDRDPTAIFWG